MYDTTKPYTAGILDLIKQTWRTPHVSVKEGIVTKKFSYPEVHHTDGIGTKGVYHWNKRRFRNAVLDALAMNLNDLAMMRAVPFALVDHLLIPKDDHEAILEIVKNLSEECKKMDISITGGETAVHDNIEGMELSITMLGFVKSPKTNQFQIGDVLIGLKSSGLHSNGFTKIREVFGNSDKEEFIEPTRNYINTILKLNEKINGMMNITGGAFTKLKSLLENADAKITRDHNLKPQNIFKELYLKDISDEEMYKTFNCGIGFVFSVPATETANALSKCDGEVIGEIIPGNGNVIINSMFSDKIIEF